MRDQKGYEHVDLDEFPTVWMIIALAFTLACVLMVSGWVL